VTRDGGNERRTSGGGAHAAVARAPEDGAGVRPAHLEPREIRRPRPHSAAEPAALRHPHDAPAADADAAARRVRRRRPPLTATDDADATLHGAPHHLNGAMGPACVYYVPAIAHHLRN
jgi:hypothetical protein